MTDKKDIFYYAKFYGIPIYYQPEENEIIGRNWFCDLLLRLFEPIEPFICKDGFRIAIKHKTITRQEIKDKLGSL